MLNMTLRVPTTDVSLSCNIYNTVKTVTFIRGALKGQVYKQ